ncbi:MAG TPA: molecular chaperone TorD family protein [Gaiellaceae bacterium]|nr:molecular chaperone TorD family protein [Gaiellaceae bacterium]
MRRSAAYLLARWWSRPVGEEIDGWDGSWEEAREAAELLDRSPALVCELEAASAASSRAALLEEYERLLVGPGRVPCAPYESLWRTDAPRRERGVLMGAAATEVARLYGELGLQVKADAHELPDQLAVEWEALAYALDRERRDVAAALLDDHLAQWVPAFAAAVAAETEEPFYAALASLTAEWAAALAA